MIRNTCTALTFCLLWFSCNTSSTKSDQAFDLTPLLDAYSAALYELNPLMATANGINDYNDRLAIDISEEYLTKALALNTKYLDTLATIPLELLSYSDKLSYDILRYRLTVETERLNGRFGYYRPVDQFVFSFPQRFATLASGAGFVPFKTETDYRNFISRMNDFQRWTDQSIRNMQMGLELKDTNPKASMQKVPAQLRPLFETPLEEHIFYKPVLNLPADLDSTSRATLAKDYSDAIEKIIKPAYKKLHDYLVNDYIPHTRTTSGLIDNGRSKNEYAFWLNYYTTTTLSADEVFELGLREVARIRLEMDSLKNLVGFKGDLKAFFNHVRTDKKFFPFTTEEEVLDRYRSFERIMQPQLAKLFNKVPKAGFEVRATEKFRQAGANAQYMAPSRDGTRPGIFYEVIPDATTYNYFDMEGLFIHEAIPGHHYQIALQQEADLPEFRKAYWNSAYVEGWALYTESLGRALGMYKDPYQYLGRLNNEVERAVRLVVDAGIHHKGWTREEAIAYVLENQPTSPEQAEQRIERYMVTAGQATSYKIGELKIIALRKKAEQALGERFDIREFHDRVLEEGSLPLTLLEQHIDHWISEKSK